jgi:hypothetical protein
MPTNAMLFVIRDHRLFRNGMHRPKKYNVSCMIVRELRLKLRKRLPQLRRTSVGDQAKLTATDDEATVQIRAP